MSGMGGHGVLQGWNYAQTQSSDNVGIFKWFESHLKLYEFGKIIGTNSFHPLKSFT